MLNRSNQLPTVYMHVQPALPVYPSPGLEAGELTVLDVTYLHFHSLLEIGVCVSGEGVCYIDDEEQPFKAGDIQIIFPFQRHLSKSTGVAPCKWYWLYIDAADILSQSGGLSAAEAIHLLQEDMAISGIIDARRYPRICQLCERIMGALADPNPRQKYREAHFYTDVQALILEMCDRSVGLPKIHTVSDDGLQQLTPAFEAIKNGLEAGHLPAVGELPTLCGMSIATFRRKFKIATGQSAKDYLTACSIRQAGKLLLSTDKKVIEIAALVGFENISGFNRSFLKATGLTPSQYRKGNRK